MQGLIAELGLPSNLAALGIEKPQGEEDPELEKLAALALADPTAPGNPLPLTPANIRPLILSCF